MSHLHPASESERGAVLVHVALAIIGLTAFTTFVVDYGVLWASRRQAQNAADGAALSGAVALAFDDPTNTTSTGPAYLSAQTVVNASRVWGEIPVADITISAAVCPAEHAGGLCVKVDVFRNQARGNPLPVLRRPGRDRRSGSARPRPRVARERHRLRAIKA
jgi:Flp pilus assembly protein TadG